jgi:signal transduction histidine kinase
MGVRDNKRLRQALRDSRAQLDAAAASEEDRRFVSRALSEVDIALAKIGEAPPSSATLPAAEPARKDLLSVICHDLKDPLASIVMGAGFLKKVIPDEQSFTSARRIVDAIARSAERMNGVIGDFYDLGKLEADQLSIDPRVLDASLLARAAYDQFAPKAREKGIELACEVAEVVGELPVACDRGRVLQIFSKLLQNAIKFTPAGGKIRVGAAREDDGALLFVADTGRGIPDDRKSTVFDRDANWKATPRDGPGLGLAIAKGLVELHGGRIGLESTLGEGTRVWFWLPKTATA